MSAATSTPAVLSILDLPDGIHKDVPEAIYHGRILGIASKSVLDKVHRSPAHYRAWVDGAPEEESAALSFGKALHCRILEPERFAKVYVVQPDFGNCTFKENKARRDAWRAEIGWDKDPRVSRVETVDAETMTALDGIARSIQAHPVAAELLCGGAAEVTAKWTDPATGIVCKGRADFWIESIGTLVDLKTTEDARPEAFARSVAQYRYHLQEAFYRDGFAQAGKPVEDFVFVAVEKRPPYAVAVYTLDRDALLRGTVEVEQDLRRMAEAIERDEWPAYGQGIQELSLPRWA